MKKCKCGKEATICVSFGRKEINFCEACLKRVTAMMKDIKKWRKGSGR